MRLYFALISVALVLSALTGVGLVWDGSYALFSILDSQYPHVAYGRFTQVPLHWIVVEVSRFTSDLTVLRFAFGIVYAALTFLALLSAWWIVRQRDGATSLFVWAALGIGLGTLPGQVCAVCQATMSVQLFYPILLAILIRIPRRTVPVVVLLAAAIFFFHPVAAALFAVAAALAFLAGVRPRVERRRMWLWALAFAGLGAGAVLRFALFHSPYETGELSPQVLNARFSEALAGLPIVALGFAWLAALLILLQPFINGPTQLRGRGFPLTLASLMIAGILLIIWASDPHQWAEEVNFREWALFVSLPFILIAALEALVVQPGRLFDAWQQRSRFVQLTGMIFLLVVSIQSLNWSDLTNRLREAMRVSPAACTSASSWSWLKGTPLDHWSLTAYSMVIQSSAPERLVMAGNGCADESFLQGLVVARFGPGNWNLRDWERGWFDLRVLARELTAVEQTPPRCSFPPTWGWYGIERSGADLYHWMRRRARIRVLLARAADATLQGELVSLQQPNEVDILLNGNRAATLKITNNGWKPFGPVPLTLVGGENSIEFVSRNAPIKILSDPRWLAIALGNPILTLEDGVTLCR